MTTMRTSAVANYITKQKLAANTNKQNKRDKAMSRSRSRSRSRRSKRGAHFCMQVQLKSILNA